ncbi:MAG: DUF2203 domain-containing protein [Deltaproteobacteria bacterium]|nr:DUF2203 domain-containing protein [Deltaproteobacteria bacterium]
MGQIVEINQKRLFSLEDARDLLPVVRRVTKSSYEVVKRLSTQLSFIPDKAKQAKIEEQIQGVIQEWNTKIRKLGCEAKGMWLVDFDSGDGYYCWRYPEPNINYFHGYFEGFRGRVKIH